MEKIIEYTYNWIKAMGGGRKFSGHDFFSGFPQPYKNDVDKNQLDTLYYSLSLIDTYDKKIELSYYDFLEDKTLKTNPWRMDKRDLAWNLLNSLKCVRKNLIKKDLTDEAN